MSDSLILPLAFSSGSSQARYKKNGKFLLFNFRFSVFCVKVTRIIKDKRKNISIMMKKGTPPSL